MNKIKNLKTMVMYGSEVIKFIMGLANQLNKIFYLIIDQKNFI